MLLIAGCAAQTNEWQGEEGGSLKQAPLCPLQVPPKWHSLHTFATLQEKNRLDSRSRLFAFSADYFCQRLHKIASLWGGFF